MKSLLSLAVPAITMFGLFGLGLDLTSEDFQRIRQRPAVICAGLLAPLALLPLVAIAIVLTLDPPPAVQAGLLLIAACPIGGISSTYTYLARASVALSVTLTALSSLLAVVSIPMLDRVFALALGRSMGFDAPVPLIVVQLLMILALPVLTGMAVRQRWPEAASRCQAPFRRAMFVAIGLLIVLIVASDPATFAHGVGVSVLVALVFVVLSFSLGWATGRAIGASAADRFTLASEFATRNIAVATAIAVTLAGRAEFAMFATAYFLTEAPLMLVAAAWFKRRPAIAA